MNVFKKFQTWKAGISQFKTRIDGYTKEAAEIETNINNDLLQPAESLVEAKLAASELEKKKEIVEGVLNEFAKTPPFTKAEFIEEGRAVLAEGALRLEAPTVAMKEAYQALKLAINEYVTKYDEYSQWYYTEQSKWLAMAREAGLGDMSPGYLNPFTPVDDLVKQYSAVKIDYLHDPVTEERRRMAYD